MNLNDCKFKSMRVKLIEGKGFRIRCPIKYQLNESVKVLFKILEKLHPKLTKRIEVKIVKVSNKEIIKLINFVMNSISDDSNKENGNEKNILIKNRFIYVK